MPQYTPPVRDTRFILEHVVGLDTLRQPARLRQRHARRGRRGARRRRQVRRRGAVPAQPVGRSGGLHAPRRRQRDDARGLQGGLSSSSSRAAGARCRRRRSSAGRRCRMSSSTAFQEYMISVQHGVRDVSRADPRRDRRVAGQGIGRAEGEIRPQHGVGQMGRHDEPDRAAMRHRSRPDPHQGRAAGGRQLRDHRHQDLHLVGRA